MTKNIRLPSHNSSVYSSFSNNTCGELEAELGALTKERKEYLKNIKEKDKKIEELKN